MNCPVRTFRETLLGETVRIAATETSFYRAHYAGIDLDGIRGVEDLVRLPPVDKAMLRAAGLRAVSGRKTFSHIQHTSGTTGEPFVVYRSVEEAGFIERFFRSYLERGGTDGGRRLQMSLQTPYHGTNTHVPSRSVVLNSANPNATTELLRRSFSIPGADTKVSIITGPLYEVCKLTQHARRAGFTAGDFEIAAIHTTGDYQTRRMRRKLAEAWGAPIFDHFSLAEAFGGAVRCHACDGFHFDPHVVPEIADVASGSVVGDGVGVLLLTCLHPFVQMQPLIRYSTGDLFRVEAGSCPTPSYHYLGRVEHALFDPREARRLLLSSVDLLEAIDAHGAVAHCDHAPLEPLVARGLVDAGPDGGVPALRIEVGLEHPGGPPPPNDVRRIEGSLREDLAARSPALASDLRSGRISLQFVFVDAGELRETIGPDLDDFVVWKPISTPSSPARVT